MNKDNIKFTNPNSGETLIHKERADGKKDLFIIQPGTERKGHLVLNNGNVILQRHLRLKNATTYSR